MNKKPITISEIGFSISDNQDREIILNYMMEYIDQEDFPLKHIEALMKITCLFNDCEESEAKIFKFANDLYGEFVG